MAIICPSAVSGAYVYLAWTPNSSPIVAGYTLYYGTSNTQFTSSLNAGTNTQITVTGLASAQTYYFVLASYNSAGVEGPYSNEVTNSIPPKPVILTQPISQTAAIGTMVVLSVVVDSVAPVYFQWYVGGVAIPGATSSTLILPQITVTNAGSYTVGIWNDGGEVTTSQAASILGVQDLVSAPADLAQAVTAGVYSGLFYDVALPGDTFMREVSTGFLSSLVIGSSGGVSSSITLGGQPFTTSGIVDAAGIVTAILKPNQAGLSNLSLTLYADPAYGTARLTGVVSNMDQAHPWGSMLSAILQTNAFLSSSNLFLSPPPPGQVQGKWTCQLTVSTNGSLTLAGQLGDGTTISQAGFIGADGSFPVYQSLYGNTGFLAGWITLADGAPMGNLTWMQPTNTTAFTTGFTNTISFGVGPGLSTNRFQLIQ